ncbi:HEAT repeat domain-containing protein [Lacunimicrobium album]
MPKALIRCRECGAARNAGPVRQSSSSTSGKVRGPSAQPEQKALSIDDMFSMAEDIGEDDINQFVIATSDALNSPPGPQSANTKSHQTPSSSVKSTNQNPGPLPQDSTAHPPLSSSISSDSPSGSSTTRAPSPIPKRSSMSGVTPAPVVGNPARRRRSSEGTASSGSAVAASVASVIRQSLKQPAPKLQKADAKKLKLQEKAAQKLLPKATKLFEKFDSDDTKPAIDSIRQMLIDLGSTQHASVVPIVAKFLDDLRPSLPESAARALGSTRCPEAFEPLVSQLLKTPIDSSGHLITALGSLGDRRAVFPLIAYGGEYPQYQTRVVDAISDIGQDAVPRLIELAGGQVAGQQLIVCLAMGKAKDSRCLESLSNLLNHDLATIRCYSAEALGDLGDTKAIKLLVSALKDPESNVRACAASALVKIPDERSVTPLVRCLKDPDRHVRLLAVNALGAIGDKSAASPLSQLLDENDPELIAATCDSLGRLGDASAIERLIQFLVLPESDEHTGLVLKVIDTVRRLQATPAVPALLELLQSPDSNIRLKAVEAIGQCKQKSAAEDIELILAKDPSDEVRAAAAKSLGELKDPESLNALVEALQDTLNVRVKTIIALGAIKNSNAVPTLIPLLKDQSPEIRYHSSQALAELDHKKAIHQIEPLVLDEVPMVVRGAFKALQKLGDERTEKQIITAVKKRMKTNKQVVSKSANSSAFLDFALVEGIRQLVWPEETHGKIITSSIAGSLVLVIAICSYLFLVPTSTHAVVRLRITGVAFDPTSEKIFVSTKGGSLETWNSPKNENYSSKDLIDFAGLVDIIAVDDKKQYAATDKNLYSVDNGEKKALSTFKDRISRLEISADQSSFAAFDYLGNSFLFSMSDGSAKGAVSLAGKDLTAYTIGHDGSYVIAAYGRKGQVRLIDKAGSITKDFTANAQVTAIAVSPDGSTLAATLEGGGCLLYSLANNSMQTILKSPEVTGGGTCARFTPDGKRLITTSAGLVIWDIEAGTASTIACSAERFRLNSDGTKAICLVGEGATTVFDFVDLATKTVVNSPYYRIY